MIHSIDGGPAYPERRRPPNSFSPVPAAHGRRDDPREPSTSVGWLVAVLLMHVMYLVFALYLNGHLGLPLWNALLTSCAAMLVAGVVIRITLAPANVLYGRPGIARGVYRLLKPWLESAARGQGPGEDDDGLDQGRR